MKYKVDGKTTIKRLIDADVELRAAKQRLPDSELGRIVGLRAADWTLNQIGDHDERTATAIRNFLMRHGAPVVQAARSSEAADDR